MKGEYKVLWAGFQAEGTGAKVRLGVGKEETRDGEKGWSPEGLEFHLVNICFYLL